MTFVLFPQPTPIFPALPVETWSVSKQPKMHATTSIGISGRETQMIRQGYPVWEFTLRYGGDAWLRDQTQNITPWAPLAGYTELEQLSGLFLQCLGSYGEFYYQDPDDYSRYGAFQGVGNGTQTLFSLKYSWGSGPYSQPMYAPIGGLISLDAVYTNGVLRKPSYYSVVTGDSGELFLSLSAAPFQGHVVAADLSFYYRCRFVNDLQEYSQWAMNLWEHKELKFISVKP